ncbi:MAG TPA: DUF6702 family protein [Flavobacterium sp.]|jgi:hypothetical protein
MKRTGVTGIFLILFIGLSSFVYHKFYVSIYQIDYVKEKKMLRITSRIFIDDLNQALFKKYKYKTLLGEKTQSDNDIEYMKRYMAEHFIIIINGQKKEFNYLSNEMEGNVLICYYSIENIAKINTLEINNTALIELHTEQQNIIQFKNAKDKQTLLLSNENTRGSLKL